MVHSLITEIKLPKNDANTKQFFRIDNCYNLMSNGDLVFAYFNNRKIDESVRFSEFMLDSKLFKYSFETQENDNKDPKTPQNGEVLLDFGNWSKFEVTHRGSEKVQSTLAIGAEHPINPPPE